MAGELGDKLAALHACFSDEGGNGGPAMAHDLVGDIGHICLQDISDKDIEYCCSLIFNRETGIVAFLKNTVTMDEYQPCKSELLEMLLAFMVKYDRRLIPYAVDIKDACVSLFTRDRLAKVKINAVPLLIELIRQTSGSNLSEELNVAKMIEKFFLELIRPSKHSATVKQHLYHLLGMFAEVYPELMMQKSDKLLETYINTLKTEMTSKTRKPELSIIAGCMRGLTHLLVHFTQSAEEGAKYSYDIYKYARNTIDPNINHTRFEMPRSGLSFFAKHAGQFNQYLIDDHESMYERFSYWANHRNPQVMHDGMSAFQEFLKQMSEHLVEQSKSSGKADTAAFKFFVKKFRSIMDNPRSSSKQISIAIRGYGYFAAPCKMFMTNEDVRFMFNEMIQRSEQIFLNQTEASIDDKLISLPSFLEALASIVTELDQISDTFLLSLERLVVLLIEHYPKLSKKLHFMCFMAIIKVYFSLTHKGAAFRGFLSRTVYQGLIRSCSHPVVLDTEGQLDEADPDEIVDQNKQKISYRDYIDLWSTLLNCTNIKELAVMEIHLEERRAFTEAVYDELISSIMRILERLDLTSNKSEEDGNNVVPSVEDSESLVPLSSDPVLGLHASKPKDFIILINLVDLAKDLLPEQQTGYFSRWVYTVGHGVILQSTKFPLVSGFYKLLAVCMKICSKTQYFKGMGESDGALSPPESEPMDDSVDTKIHVVEEAGERAQKEACFLLFNKFTKEVIQRLQQYKDDLLAACLTFILSLPQEIVISQMVTIIPALKTTFELGRSYLPLAIVGLDALDLWSASLPPHTVQPYFSQILPCLDAFLRTSPDKAGDMEKTLSLISTSSKKKGKKKIPVKLLKTSRKEEKNQDSQLEVVRQRCVSLLGSLGGSVNSVLVQKSSEEMAKVAVAWDTVKHLKFDFPFMDIKPTIYMDPFLPRIVELALTSSDRQTKVAACELLHSMVLYMLGRSVQQPSARRGGEALKQPMEQLYRKVFPAIVQLACDVEMVCKQLFEPLMMQLIHWFTGSKLSGSPDTAALLDTLMDCIVSPTDTAGRDFSAKCIKEFLHWTIKQTSKKELQRNQACVKGLLKRVYGLARHPSAFNRLGAAMAFNSMYTVFREEETLVDLFTFELLCIFVESLALAHNDDKSLGTAEHCKQSLAHLERIIRVKKELFQKPTKTRTRPKQFATKDLQCAMKWLIRQCGRPQTECRHTCMDLVCKLAPCIQNSSNPKEFFDFLLNEKTRGPAYFIQRFEAALYKPNLTTKSGISKKQTLGLMADTFTLTATLNWFDLLLAALDCYMFVFTQDLLTPAKIFSGKESVLFSVLAYFVDTLASGDLRTAAQQFSHKTESDVFTPREYDQYNRAKCTVIVRIMDFITVMLGRHRVESLRVMPASFWSHALWDMIICCCLEPTVIGFNMGDVETMDNLPERVSQLLWVLNKVLPKDKMQSFANQLKVCIGPSRRCNLFGELPDSLGETSPKYLGLTHLVRGYELLYESGVLSQADTGAGVAWAEKLITLVFKSLVAEHDGKLTIVSLSPVCQALNERILTLAFKMALPSSSLLKFLMDKTPLYNVGSTTTSPHGALFYATFRTTITSHLVGKTDSFIAELVNYAVKEWSIVGNIITGILDQVSRDRETRKKQGPGLVSSVLNRWQHLNVWWLGDQATQETKVLALGTLTKMILIDSQIVSEGKHAAFPEVFTMYLSLLTDSKTSLAFKSRVLDLLPFFANLAKKDVQRLRSSLDRFIADSFPIQSTEYPAGSPKYNDYINALNKFLTAFELSGSLMLLEVLISIMCKEERHVYEQEIQNSIATFVRRLQADKHKLALDVPYNIFTAEDSYKNNQRMAALERVCLSLLRLVKLPALTEFYLDHIKDIMKTVEAKQTKTSDAALETQVVSKLCCYELIEVMYSRLSKDDVNSKDSRVNNVYCGGRVEKGNEMSAAIIKAAHATKSENMRGETVALGLRRQLHCAAYNCLVAVISCTQTEPKFYLGFLFKDNINKGQMLWDNLIDLEKRYEFPIEMEKPLARRKKFVSIRNEVRESRQSDYEDQYTPVNYLASQYLADSSLGGDVNQFDFGTSSHASVFSASGSASQGESFRDRGRFRRESSAGSSSGPQEALVTVEDDYVEMEMDELNQHECMASLTALLQHMARNKITPEVNKGETPDHLPPWMDMVREKMVNHATHLNVKLFLAKVIVNTEEVFRPYAKFWLSPLVQLVVSGDLGKEGIHYFMTDMVVTMLSWHTVAIPENNSVDRAMASRLVEFLMSHCHHDSRPVLKNNLEVIKTLVEAWRTRIDVPTKVLYDNFTDKEARSTRNATGIQLVGVVLANKLNPLNSAPGVDKDKFYKYLAMNMQSPLKQVYAASAEVVGMALKYLSDTEKSADGQEWLATYADNVSKMLLSTQDSKPDLFINSIFRMQIHYPPISNKFISKILFLLPKVHGEFKTNCLEIIQNRVDSLEGIFTEMKNKGLLKALTHRDEATQHVALKLVRAMLRHLKPGELLYLLPSVTTFTSSPSTLCRTVMYEILMWIYDNYRDENSPEGDQILQLTKDCLLQGLSDDDLKNRLTVQNFWSHETRLPTGTLDRMVAMLEAMYCPSTESQYLSYATNLLLEMTSKSPDYNREVFEHPLSECKFEDYRVSSSWRQRHAAMTPLFVETQLSSQAAMASLSATSDTQSSGQVRATQDIHQFSATQEQGGSRAPYNWLTQSSLDTLNFSQTLPSESQSTLLFTVGASTPNPRYKAKPLGQGFGTDRMGKKDQANAPESSQAVEILRLKRRFIKDQEASRVYFAKRMSRMKKVREDIQREQKQRRENQVTMYRRYRIGDLPDIQIKYSYIIAPLQALAQRDGAIARLLFSSIFKAIFAEIENVKTEREAREMVEKINSCLNLMISTSTQYYPTFIGCVLDIALENPKRLKLEPSSVNTSCLTSLQQPLGIVLLEEMLIVGDSEAERPTKRKKGMTGASATVSQDTNTWLELARLYKSQGDYDVLRGIFGNQIISTQKLTKQAMEYEMRGDYQAALNKYKEGLDREDWDENPSEVEKDLWEDSRLQCLDNLGKWEKLMSHSTVNIDDQDPARLDKVWDDTYYQEHYLPYILRSHLKLLVDGDDRHAACQQALLHFVDQSMKVTERKALLESRYSEELALLYLCQEDYDRSRHYSNMAISGFLQDWSSMDSLMSSSRTTRLQHLQKLTELSEFLSFMKNDVRSNSSYMANKLIDKWLKRQPDELMDSPSIWDDVISNRCIYLERMSHHLDMAAVKMEVDEDDQEQHKFQRQRILLRLSQANAANQQDNFPVALDLLRNTIKPVKQLSDNALQLQWTHVYARTHQKKSQVGNMDLGEKLNALVGTLTNLEKYGESCKAVLKANAGLHQDHSLLRGQGVHLLTTELQNGAERLEDIGQATLEKIQNVTGCAKDNFYELVLSLIEIGYIYINEAVVISCERDINGDQTGSVKANLALFKYCDGFLRQKDQDDSSSVECASYTKFPEVVVTSLLRAMKNNSVEARQLFPRLLQIVELYPDTMDTFISLARDIPCWMFIGWIGQMTAVLDKPESPVVQDILLGIAQNYPNALIYPFRMSRDGYRFENTPYGKKAKQVYQKLNAMLTKNREVDRFINALEQFGQPNELFKDWASDGDLARLLAKPKANSKRILAMYRAMYNQLIEPPDDSQDDQSLYGSPGTQEALITEKMGPYFIKFAKKFKEKMHDAFGPDGSKILEMNRKEFQSIQNILYVEMKKAASDALKPPGTLKEYSSYLAEYQDENLDPDHQLEIPGQYTGQCKPLPEYHTQIAGFSDKILVLSSIRKPKKLVIQGNDAKDYSFLVKGGEDLRQDQRIEQLFGLMNEIFSQDPVCKQRKLELRTYQVIPMTPRVGMIEWMSKTMVLKEFLYGALTEKERAYITSQKGPNQDQIQMISNGCPLRGKPSNHPVCCYGASYSVGYKTDIVTAFRRKEGLIPWDLARRAYQTMSASSEAYFMLKSNFATSHALLSICQYVVGIGDRHLSNFMVDLENGNMVGIDFGHAFGTATQFLPVPELMPFRMTRVLRNMMMPLGEKGLIENTMIHSLRAMRNHCDILLNTMDVFIKEPSLDWKNNATRQMKTMAGHGGDISAGDLPAVMKETDELDSDWYPKEKIKIARQKLNGYNPAYITRKELTLGHSKNENFKNFVRVALGDKVIDIRAQVASKGLSVEQQVACLLNQSTDPKILGRTWVGWEAWV